MPKSEQSEANPPKSSERFVEHLWQYLASHPITAAWNASLLIGGAVFISYFASIGFIPELDFQASVSLLVAAAVVGVYFFLVFISLLLLPGWIWTTGVIGDDRLKPLWHKEPETETLPQPEWARTAWFVLPNFLVAGGFFAAIVWCENFFIGPFRFS